MKIRWAVGWASLGLSVALASVQLSGIQHQYQKLNNCGPTTLSMALSYWNVKATQQQIALKLKPDRLDRNVSPHELAAYARNQGMQVHQGVAGSPGLLRQLLGAGFPVIVETWMVVAGEGGMGHYRLLVGFNDQRLAFRAYDSYYGPGVSLPYSPFEKMWKVFNYTYLVLYPTHQQDKLRSILGRRLETGYETRLALDIAQKQLDRQPADLLAWFNRGSVLMALGQPAQAALAFDQARQLPTPTGLESKPGGKGWPWRMLWYQFAPYQAYQAVGRSADVLALANQALATTPTLEESLYWRALAYQSTGKPTRAQRDLEAALAIRPTYPEARLALAGLSR